MNIRTPKRYRGVQRRSGFSCQRFFMWGILLILIVAGVVFYQSRAMFQPQIDQISGTAIASIQSWNATQSAPPATPTQDPSNLLVTGDDAWARGNITEALGYYEQIINSLPNDVMLHVRMATAYATRGDDENARRYGEYAVTADPFSAEAWSEQAFVQNWTGDYTGALASSSQALAINENNAHALAQVAFAYLRVEQYDRALSRANDAIAANPDDWNGYWVRGLINEEAFFDFITAQQDYERAAQLALEQNPAMAGVAASGLARVLVRGQTQANFARAIEALDSTLLIDPDNVTALYHLGWVQYSFSGERGQALNPLEDCAEIDPDNYRCLYLLGRAREDQDDQVGALEAFLAAIEAETPSAFPYWWAAEMQRVLGSCTDAAPYLETGYQMVIGDLPSENTGNTSLQGDFETSMITCGLSIRAATPTPEPLEAEDQG